MARTIFHVDMDAFYAAVEQRDHPRLRGKPVVVGADPQGGRGRGVVAACSYEARRFGIRSAMPISKAYRLCPQAMYVRPDFAKYSAVSRSIRSIFFSFTEWVEPVSIDEAFLDMSDKVTGEGAALEAARSLKHEIFESQQLTASVGIAPNKFVAKIASDLKKPDALVVVRPEEVQSFLDPLPISRLWGVGPKTDEKLRALGIATIRELREADQTLLKRRFGKLGEQLWQLAHGIDERPVVVYREPYSISHETTFSRDVVDTGRLERTLEYLCENVAQRLYRRRLLCKTVTLKLRYADFTTVTRQHTLSQAFQDAADIFLIAQGLFRKYREAKRKVRLVGVAVSSLQPPSPNTAQQLRLFPRRPR